MRLAVKKANNLKFLALISGDKKRVSSGWIEQMKAMESSETVVLKQERELGPISLSDEQRRQIAENVRGKNTLQRSLKIGHV